MNSLGIITSRFSPWLVAMVKEMTGLYVQEEENKESSRWRGRRRRRRKSEWVWGYQCPVDHTESPQDKSHIQVFYSSLKKKKKERTSCITLLDTAQSPANAAKQNKTTVNYNKHISKFIHCIHCVDSVEGSLYTGWEERGNVRNSSGCSKRSQREWSKRMTRAEAQTAVEAAAAEK